MDTAIFFHFSIHLFLSTIVPQLPMNIEASNDKGKKKKLVAHHWRLEMSSGALPWRCSPAGETTTNLLHHPRQSQTSAFYVGLKSGIKRVGYEIISINSQVTPGLCMFDLFHNLRCFVTHPKRAHTQKTCNPRGLEMEHSSISRYNDDAQTNTHIYVCTYTTVFSYSA